MDPLRGRGRVGAAQCNLGLLDVAHKLPAEVCETQGLVLDKFFGVRRPAGNHLYRTSLLSKALGLIPLEGEDIRPEHLYAEQDGVAAGHPWMETPLLVGVHDFEHTTRISLGSATSTRASTIPKCISSSTYWRRMASQDDDYQVALWGFAAGIAETGEVQVDVRQDYGFSSGCRPRSGRKSGRWNPARSRLGRLSGRWPNGHRRGRAWSDSRPAARKSSFTAARHCGPTLRE